MTQSIVPLSAGLNHCNCVRVAYVSAFSITYQFFADQWCPYRLINVMSTYTLLAHEGLHGHLLTWDKVQWFKSPNSKSPPNLFATQIAKLNAHQMYHAYGIMATDLLARCKVATVKMSSCIGPRESTYFGDNAHLNLTQFVKQQQLRICKFRNTNLEKLKSHNLTIPQS